jgi:hypothetical protein
VTGDEKATRRAEAGQEMSRGTARRGCGMRPMRSDLPVATATPVSRVLRPSSTAIRTVVPSGDHDRAEMRSVAATRVRAKLVTIPAVEPSGASVWSAPPASIRASWRGGAEPSVVATATPEAPWSKGPVRCATCTPSGG